MVIHCEITQGRLIYTGNLLNNPGLDIKASKQFETAAFEADQSQFASEHNTTSVLSRLTKVKPWGWW